MTDAPRPRTSVVVPARDAEGSIGACVRSLLAQRDELPGGLEVIVVDDGSRDETARVAESAGAHVVRAGGDGPARARNLGVRAARGELIVFTDADCTPRPGFLRALVAPLDDPTVAGAKGAYETEQRSLTARFVQQEYEERYARMARRSSIDFVDTYAAVYRRSVLEAVGGFDERYRLPSTEDQELSFRVAAAGHRLVFAPSARVAHLHADRPWSYARKKFKIGCYKVATLRRHPRKALRDAHTPASLKLQVLLFPVATAAPLATPFALLLGPLGPLWAAACWTPLTACGLSALPLWARAARADPPLALAAPLLIALRAGALGAGLTVGILREFAGGVLPRNAPASGAH